MVLLSKLLHVGIYVRCFFKASWSYQKLVSEGSPGGLGGSKNRSWRGPGGFRRRPRGFKKRFGRGKSAQERRRAILEPSWVRKRQSNRFRVNPFGRPGATFGEALGRLGGAFLNDLVAHRFFIDFLSIFIYFWYGFWYQNSKKKR